MVKGGMVSLENASLVDYKVTFGPCVFTSLQPCKSVAEIQVEWGGGLP